MSKLLVVGAGGHGKVVADAALCSGWGSIAFLDDRRLNDVFGLPVVGTFADLPDQRRSFSAAVVAVGNAAKRLQLLGDCAKHGFETPCIVHPSAVVSRFASLGPGCVVLAQAAVNAGARLGRGCIVNTGGTVDHDCALGDGCHVCPGAHLAGDVRVGDCTWIGIGAVVREGISIGDWATIGAGAVVVKDVGSGELVVGVPGRSRPR